MGISNPRLLIAEPDHDIRASLEIYFKNNGYEIRAVEAADEILKVCRPWQPNVILISDEFTGTDPYQICRDLLDDTLTGHIPIVMLLHLNERRARLEALEVGVNDIITKPFDIEELRLRIEAAIRLSTMRLEA
ncbi:MAG: response regulator transcription factor [Anaerolineae bacterium]|nr:response regulator transcription factor [Anaerolineae bacterium]